MNTSVDARQLDSKGRITIPKSIQERLDLTAGDHVDIDVEDGAIVIRPRVSREAFAEQMKGCINEKSRSGDRQSLQSKDLKATWISDLPSVR